MLKSMNKAFVCLVLAIGLMTSFQSCKPSVPSQYLSKGEMEDILYDIHVAEAMSSTESQPGGERADMITYKEAILKKYGVTSEDFDSSMVYYMRHTKLLHDIYVKLGDRLTAEAQSLGADVNDMNRFGNVSSGDTANVWNGARSMVLSASAPLNYSSFDIPVDSGFHKGDRLMLDFEAQFIFQDGMRDGVAMIAVTFQNDSVASGNIRMSSSQHYSLQLEDRDSLGIKSVKGYFLLNNGDFNSSPSLTTLKLMFLQNIKLVRMHNRPSQNPMNGTGPSNESSAADVSPGNSPATPSGPGLRPRMSGSAPQPSQLPPVKMEMANEPKPISKD
mgnify:CR=1 FL=1